MDTPLLQTKLYIPAPRPEWVPRPRLIERLNAGLHRKLTLVSAPAGFGKTTLVSEWLSGCGGPSVRREPKVRTAWLSLDESDNDLTRFLTYLIAALQAALQTAPQITEAEIGKGVSSALASPQPPPAEAILTTLINEIAVLTDRIVLVLDDYHLIEAQPIHDGLAFLLEHLPPDLHLVLTTREDPPLSLSRLRARGQLTEIRATDLRFTSSEAAEFFNQVMGLDLSAEDIATLGTRTEGWIAGLQLASLALQGTSMQGRNDVTGFVQSFAGSHRYVLDYLVEEVLEQQPDSVQEFLLQTSILDRLYGPLCDAILLAPAGSGQETLEYLEHANLFVISLDDDRRWYRYHHLFADLLRQRLHQEHPSLSSPSTGGIVAELHIRASEWNAQNGFADYAIEYALRAQDFERAACMIEEHIDALWHRGELGRMRRWLERLPVEMVLSKPRLCIFRAGYLLVSGQQDACEHFLQAAEKVLESSSDRALVSQPLECNQLAESESTKLRGRIAVIRALIGVLYEDAPGAIWHAGKALEYLPEQDLTWRSIAAITLGDAHTHQGDMTASYQSRFEALKASKATGDIYLVISANMKLAWTLRAQGRLQRTLQVCQQQMQPANEFGLSQTHVVGWLLAIWGDVLAELNDLDGAIDQAKKGVELTERDTNLGALGRSYLHLMRVLFSSGDLTGAEEIIQKTKNLARESDVPPWLTNQMATWQTRLWLVQDELQAASQWARERGLNTDGQSIPLHKLDYYLLFEYIMLARVLIAQSRLDQATGLLQRLLEAAEAGERTCRVIEILSLQALTFQAQGNTDRAIITLEPALALAEPEGFVRTFVDEGPPMARLLYEAVSRGVRPDYAGKLLAAFPDLEAAPGAKPDISKSQISVRPAVGTEIVEPLSERELEVLALVAEGLTNREIAARLYLTLNTVKVHTSHIYGKLGVHSRTQAVARARTLGLLSSI